MQRLVDFPKTLTMPTALGGVLKMSNAMTPEQNVEHIVNEMRVLILNDSRTLGRIAKDLDMGYATICRSFGSSRRPNKHSCSMPTLASLADYFGLEIKLVPKGSK